MSSSIWLFISSCFTHLKYLQPGEKMRWSHHWRQRCMFHDIILQMFHGKWCFNGIFHGIYSGWWLNPTYPSEKYDFVIDDYSLWENKSHVPGKPPTRFESCSALCSDTFSQEVIESKDSLQQRSRFLAQFWGPQDPNLVMFLGDAHCLGGQFQGLS